MNRFLVFFILLLAAVLRIWGIGAGLPFVKIHIDENSMLNLALAAVPLKGALWTSGSGFLMPYLLLPVYIGYYVLGIVIGLFSSPESFLISYLSDTGTFILLGRLFNVVVSLVTVWLIGKIGRKWFGGNVGILSALFLAVSFIHVKESHYIKNDILVGLIVLTIFHFGCLIAKEGKRIDYILAGTLIGLAFGVKIYPILAVILILTGHIIFTKRHKTSLFNKNILLAIVYLFLTIFVQSFITLAQPGGVEEFIRIGRVIGNIASRSQGSILISYLGHLKEGMGILILIASFIGGIFALKKRKKYPFLLLMVFPVFYLLTVEFWGGYNIPRHAIVLLPFFIILAAVGVGEILKKSVLIIACAILLSLPTLLRSIKMDIYFSGKDTRELAKNWIESNIDYGTKIVIEGTLKPYIPAGAAPLLLSRGAIEREIERSERLGASTTSLKALLKANQGKASYDILATPKIDRKYNIETGEETQMNSAAIYRQGGYEYLATSSWAQYESLGSEFRSDFEKNYEKIMEFRPDVNFLTSLHDTFIEYEKVDSINLLKGVTIVGPTVSIYKLKEN